MIRKKIQISQSAHPEQKPTTPLLPGTNITPSLSSIKKLPR